MMRHHLGDVFEKDFVLCFSVRSMPAQLGSNYGAARHRSEE
jgi:hypothetical protein